jgi:alpha-D-ribose 1-methylphosphonate 5-triphosphate synthase subunit PhnH
VSSEPLSTIEECAVCCFELADEDVAVVLVCAHVFHEECIIPWLKLHASCPVCRREVTRTSLIDRANAFTPVSRYVPPARSGPPPTPNS